MSDGDAWVMLLNNYCQEKKRSSPTWTEEQSGPLNALSWTVKVFLGGVEYGRGTARTKMDAKALAAEMALRALTGEDSAA
ncbi:hypothetical protein C8Q70DRAFT_1057925 [Cubamyces menziesii]|nr:hypothetical protein C8Q70DRAFT_1057925 [Cubamyces menziesii]